jgi:hypothetical protein
MALTLVSEQRLKRVNLIDFYNKSHKKWEQLARRSYRFIAVNFPDGAAIHPDDVAKALRLLLEVNEDLIKQLNSKKLKQKYYISDFGDLILDRTWDVITT